MIALTDTHCHLDFHTFDRDRVEVVQRARDAGVKFIVNPGIDLESSLAAIQLADTFTEVYAAVGIHPNSARTWGSNSMAALSELASHPKVVAIGEIGLDYYRDRAPRELQKIVFTAQLELAAIKHLPVIIHSRESSNDALDLIDAWSNNFPKEDKCPEHRLGVFHSFSGDAELAREVTTRNMNIGLTGPVTFRNAHAIQSVVAGIPLEFLLIETDAPFLAPHPLRGSRNEPGNIIMIASKIAELQSTTIEAIAKATSENAYRQFTRRDIH